MRPIADWMDYDGMIDDFKILEPYVLSNEVGFFSNVTLEGPVGPGIIIEAVTAFYPEESNKPEYRVFGLSGDIDREALRRRILGLRVREEVVRKFRELEASWQHPLLRNALMEGVAGECLQRHLPICAVALGKSRTDEQTNAAVMYWRSGMPPNIALELLKEAIRQVMIRQN